MDESIKRIIDTEWKDMADNVNLNETGEFTIASELGSMTYQRLLKEAEKCMLLCSNCHRELHYNESEEFAEVNRDSETTLPDLLCEESEVSDVSLCFSVDEGSSDFNWAEQG